MKKGANIQEWAEKNNPRLLQEWADQKSPSEMTIGQSRVKVQWICSQCTHSYLMTPYNRKQGKGCPKCSGRYIDLEKYSVKAFLPEKMKYWDYELNSKSPAGTSRNEKSHWRCNLGHKWTAVPTKTMKCPYCINKRVLRGFNDAETLFPNLAKEWSPKNTKRFYEVTAYSRERGEWICIKNPLHIWEATVGSRSGLGNGCPYCAGQRINETNDFKTKHSHLEKEWGKRNSTPSIPIGVSSSSSEKVWWECSQGHEWLASYASRARGRSCRVCGGKEIILGFNDLHSKRPHIAAFYSDKNEDSVKEIFNSSTKEALWNCEECNGEFTAKAFQFSTKVACKECRKSSSCLQLEVEAFIKNCTSEEVVSNDRTLLSGSEIDIYIPSLSLGFEVNGSYWHSDKALSHTGNTALERHERKRGLSEDKGVKLYFVWEDDWKNKRKEVETAILAVIGGGEASAILTTLSKG